MNDAVNYAWDPAKHGVVFDELITEEKVAKLNQLIDLKESDDPAARDFADEMAYYLSAGEAELGRLRID